MARTITWDELRDLAAFEAQEGAAISLYLDLDPAVSPTPADARTRINSLLDEGGKSEAAASKELTHAGREALRSDFERIRRYFDQEFAREGARGLAVFCDTPDALWSTLPLTGRVSDDVRLDKQLYLAPLVPLVGHGVGALVVVVSREQGRFYRLRDGRLDEVTDLSDEQPRRHDQGGWSQARYQRHVDELAAEHLRQVADTLDKLVRRAHGNVDVVVTSPEESWGEFSGLLSQPVRAALAGWTHAESHASPAELLDVALPVLEEARAKRERTLLERWREEAGRNGRATAGWKETLEAVSDGRVETLLVSDGTEREAWRCPRCGRASAEAGECPLDGTSMERVDTGVDVAVHQALRHGGTVWVAQAAQDLGPAEGIGALLRY